MVHSVEPGIYFIPELIAQWKATGRNKAFLNFNEIEKWSLVGGMRIEEDWCITDTGARRLGPELDKSIVAIEQMRAHYI